MLDIIILAAGKGTRMKSDKAKVLFEAAGDTMIDYVIDSARKLKPNKIIVVVGNNAEAVTTHIKSNDIEIAVQKEQLGTADAVKAALDFLDDKSHSLILCGDMPLIKSDTLQKFIENAKSDVNFISVKMDNPTGYGRVVYSPTGIIIKIVEEKDANKNEKSIKEVNTGVYFVKNATLKKSLAVVKNNNAQKEFYLTDIVKNGADVYKAENAKEFSGINDRLQLASASKYLWLERAEAFMKEGVSVLDPSTFYSDKDVKIACDTVVYPNVTLSGKVTIGKNCIIQSGVCIKDSIIGDNCEIKDNSLIESSIIGDSSSVGPMAHLRPGSVLKGNNKVGNFVELKKTTMGIDSKASHLTYLGDAEIGKDVNIGCGTITCNYDGFNKYKTTIGDNVFVGSDVQFVAPVTIGEGALIAAGSTIVTDVPAHNLSIARSKQANIEGRADEINKRNKAKKLENH